MTFILTYLMESNITVDYLYDLDNHIDICNKFPNLPTKCVIIGLPCCCQLLLNNDESLSKMETSDCTPDMWICYLSEIKVHYVWMSKKENIYYSGDWKPIRDVSDIHFCNIDQKNYFYGKNGPIKYPDDIPHEKTLIILSATIRCGSTMKVKKIFIDLNKNSVVTSDNEIFSYDECFVLISKNKIKTEVFTHEVEFVALSKHCTLPFDASITLLPPNNKSQYGSSSSSESKSSEDSASRNKNSSSDSDSLVISPSLKRYIGNFLSNLIDGEDNKLSLSSNSSDNKPSRNKKSSSSSSSFDSRSSSDDKPFRNRKFYSSSNSSDNESLRNKKSSSISDSSSSDSRSSLDDKPSRNRKFYSSSDSW